MTSGLALGSPKARRLRHAAKLLALWNDFKFPKEVKVLGRYLLIGRHISVAIFEAPNEASVLKITHPFREIGIAHAAPAMKLEEALKMMEKMQGNLIFTPLTSNFKYLLARQSDE